MSAPSGKYFINCEECLPVRDFGEGVEGVVCPISGSFKKATDGCKDHGIKNRLILNGVKGEAMKRSEAGLKGERETISISLVISKEHFEFLEGLSVIEGASRSALIRKGIDLLIAQQHPPPVGASVVSDQGVIAEQLRKSAEARLRVGRMISSDKKLLRPARVELRCVNYGKLERKGKTDGR